MRSLPVLLIALGLLPLAYAGAKCYEGVKTTAPPGAPNRPTEVPKTETTCTNDFCFWKFYEGTGQTGEVVNNWMFACGEAHPPKPSCAKEGCKKALAPSGALTECCCKGDLCNGSETATPPRVSAAPKAPAGGSAPGSTSGSGPKSPESQPGSTGSPSGSIKCTARGKMSGLNAAAQQQFDDRAASMPTVETCEPGIEYCIAFSGIDSANGIKFDGAGCQDADFECAKEGCAAKKNEQLVEGGKLTLVGQQCCCKGDMCTPATPVSGTGAKCYRGSKIIGPPEFKARLPPASPKKEMACASDFCFWMYVERTGPAGEEIKAWTHMCGEAGEPLPPCTKDGCETVPTPAGDGTMKTCCCKGDLCNGSETTDPPKTAGGSSSGSGSTSGSGSGSASGSGSGSASGSGSSSPATAPTALLSLAAAAAVLAARF